jgi:hypothetical protein
MASLFIPVILGTTRKGRRSENAGAFCFRGNEEAAGRGNGIRGHLKYPNAVG